MDGNANPFYLFDFISNISESAVQELRPAQAATAWHPMNMNLIAPQSVANSEASGEPNPPPPNPKTTEFKL